MICVKQGRVRIENRCQTICSRLHGDGRGPCLNLARSGWPQSGSARRLVTCHLVTVHADVGFCPYSTQANKSDKTVHDLEGALMEFARSRVWVSVCYMGCDLLEAVRYTELPG